MSADKYRFVSPGVFITEVDQSQVTTPGTNDDGPIIIGRAAQGPSFKPTRVHSYNEFVQIFGDTVAGGQAGDVWRNGNLTTPMYGTYAAKAYLANNNPITFVRLLGAQDTNASQTSEVAGAAGWSVKAPSNPLQNGALGLFVFPSGSGDNAELTGTLAAVWYCTGAAPVLSGAANVTTTQTVKNGTVIVGSAGAEFKVMITGSNSIGQAKSFNFTPSSSKFIRKVFNTNPIRTNDFTEDSARREGYWLGETYEKAVNALDTTTYIGMILGLKQASFSTNDWHGYSSADGGPKASETGQFISQDISAPAGNFNPASSTTELFKFVGLTANGSETQSRVKVSIKDIRIPSAQEQAVDPYPTFTVELRHLKDSDVRPVVLETYSGCNLNPNSSNYICRLIGDKYEQYDSATQRLVEYGDYDNLSKYVRVKVNAAIAAGSENSALVPFGVKGPLRYNPVRHITFETAIAPTDTPVTGGAFYEAGSPGSGYAMNIGGALLHGEFPALSLIVSSSDMGFTKHRDATFGVNCLEAGSTNRFDDSTIDLIRQKPPSISSFVPGTYTQHQYVFTLDNIVISGSGADGAGETAAANSITETTPAIHVSGSRAGADAAGRQSYTALSGAAALVNTRKVNKFTTVMHGGQDGLNIREGDPFRNSTLDGSRSWTGTTDLTNYARHSINRALNIISDAETTTYDLAAMPGVTVPAFTNKLIENCEERGDALAVIDVENDYIPVHEGDGSSTYPILPNVTTAVNSMRSRTTDSSYGCAYYPWVQTRDVPSGQMLWVPPSVVGLGTLGSSAARTELWFAPAGFNRGGLSQGAGGIAVTNVRTKLTSQQRDDLYDVRINPIASFPTEGIVVFGQKTMQLQRSALDRINVRRLMIFLKKKISQIANTILFDQNVQTTWNRFKSEAEPLLKDVTAKFGLEDYRLILDETTTTPDLRDRNVMYAKVFLKPAKAIEFIAIDFFITNSGASFED